ncbi:MAG: S41 family peptidase [Candidatus Saccharimonadales bacterium]
MKVLSNLKRLINDSRRNKWVVIGVTTALVAIGFGLGVAVGDGQLPINFWFSSNGQNSGLPAQLNYSTVTQVYDALKQNYNGKLTANQLLNGLKEGLAEATGDPYTEYFTPSESKEFSNELDNSFSGIGVELGTNSNGNLIVISPIKGFPADKAGLQPQDIITTINGQDTTNMSLDAAVNAIRGQVNTKVTLGILRSQSQTLNFTITRQNIELPSVTSKMLAGNIGYMQISTFANDTSSLAKKAAQKFKQANVKGIILDLRGNPGGLLNAAVNVSSLWLPTGDNVVQEKGTIGNITYAATGDDILDGIPTVVLINDGSASASEITAGALHDNHVAWLIGTKSFGKGVVQDLLNFPNGSELKVTVASWYRPNGQNIEHKGITPDQTVNMNASNIGTTNDAQLTAAENYLATH